MVPPCTTINLGHSISWGNHEAEDKSIFFKQHDHATLMSIHITHDNARNTRMSIFSSEMFFEY